MLIGDRFIALDDRIIDLASGQPVLFRRWPPVGRPRHLAWVERCAALSRGTGRLLDYGVLAGGERFEAFRMRAVQAAGTQLSPALTRQLEAVISQASDLFDTGCFGEPRQVKLALSRGLRCPAILDILARHARLNGFVPISVDLLLNAERSGAALAAPLREVLETRHVLLIVRTPIECNGHGWCAPSGRVANVCPVAVARVVLSAGVSSARPNVLLLISDDREAAARSLAACQRRSSPGPLGRDRAGVHTGGVPWDTRVRAEVAAEAHEPYAVVSCAEFSSARSQALAAIARAARAPSRRAEHVLRDAMGALARRRDWSGAGRVEINLGRLLLERGRALEAARMFEAARQHFDGVNDLQGAVRAAVYLGLAWTDDERLTEAEAAFRTARMAADHAGLAHLLPDIALGLARCLYWQGRFDEATVLTASLSDTTRDDAGNRGVSAVAEACRYPDEGAGHLAVIAREAQAVQCWPADATGSAFQPDAMATQEVRSAVRTAALCARIALARGDLRGAGAHANDALQMAEQSARPIDACVAHAAAAAVYGALNDVDAVRDHVRRGTAAARRAHAPLRALRLRLLACDTLGRAGCEREAARLAARLARLDAGRFPALLRTRLQIIVTERRAPANAAHPHRSTVPAHMVAASCPWRERPQRLDVAGDIVRVLQMCHDVEDEEAALGRVCSAIRERTRAAAAGIVGRNGDAPALLGRSGPAPGRSTVAGRILDSGLAVAPIATPFGVEAGSSIRYAGRPIGAVVCRWPADSLLDGDRITCLLSAAAAAVAPHVRSLLDARCAAAPAAAEDGELIGVSEAIQVLRRAVARAAAAPFPVLVQGESGSGKELVARAIHREGPRRARRFCALNCAALTDDLLEAELFGHARGAFTGAIAERMGLFEEANGGTLFLDEVADLSARAQAKLLRAVQDGEVRRIGENFSRHVDARLIAATNRRLESEVAAGRFRRDLFYRLNVVHIDVPPLRDRPDDIAVLAGHFWRRSVERIGSRATLAPGAIAALARYDWPGNVRELQNVMASLAVSAPRRGSIGPRCLPDVIARAESGAATLDAARRAFERRFVRAALARAAGHRSRAASALGISRQGLAKLMARLDLTESGDVTE